MEFRGELNCDVVLGTIRELAYSVETARAVPVQHRALVERRAQSRLKRRLQRDFKHRDELGHRQLKRRPKGRASARQRNRDDNVVKAVFKLAIEHVTEFVMCS